ncbi:type II toxin-antitoxin system YoeB family toxin [Brevibacterium sp. CFH 10365]
MFKLINLLIDACLREPFDGIGGSEQLNYGAQGWSRRIVRSTG